MPQAIDPALRTDPDDSAARHRLTQQAVAWKKRSRRINVLRLLFPGLIIALVVVIFGWMVVQSVINSMNVYNADGDEIRMTNPLYTDRGDKGNRYELRGVEAVRRGRNSPIVNLTAPRLEIRNESNRQSRIEAAAGIYNDEKKTFDIEKDVLLRSGQDVQLRTQQASVNLQSAIVTGNGPVEATWQGGQISAQGFRIEDNGNRLIFSGKGERQVTGTLSGETAPVVSAGTQP